MFDRPGGSLCTGPAVTVSQIPPLALYVQLLNLPHPCSLIHECHTGMGLAYWPTLLLPLTTQGVCVKLKSLEKTPTAGSYCLTNPVCCWG
jgi:hypothetical protein